PPSTLSRNCRAWLNEPAGGNDRTTMKPRAPKPFKEAAIDSVLKRNLAELNNAILKRRALIGLHNAESYYALDFFRIAADALFNDMFSHAINVFDLNRRAASLWLISRAEPV